MADFYNHQSEVAREQFDTEKLMMPGNYLPRRHRDRSMPARAPRLNATPSPQAQPIPPGTRVTKPGYGYTGTLISYTRKHRTDWAVVKWDRRQFTAREYPHAIEVLEDHSQPGGCP